MQKQHIQPLKLLVEKYIAADGLVEALNVFKHSLCTVGVEAAPGGPGVDPILGAPWWASIEYDYGIDYFEIIESSWASPKEALDLAVQKLAEMLNR